MSIPITLQIEDMSCGHCIKAVTDALTGLEGIRTHNVAVGSAQIEASDAAAVARAVTAIGDAGYTARVTPMAGTSKQPGCCGGEGHGCC